MNTAATFVEVVGIAALVLGCGYVIRMYPRGRMKVHRLPPQPVRACLEAVPEPVREVLPARTPVAWQVPMYEELQSVSPHLSLEVHRLLLLILEKHASEWADELARELQAARQVVRRELAS